MVKAAKMKKPVVHKVEAAASNGPDKETFHIHLGEILRARAKVEAVRKVLKAARRAAQDAGFNLHDLDEMISMREQEPETVQDTIRRKAQYATWMGLAPGVQGDLFDHAAARQDDKTKWFEEGYVDGLEGVTAAGDRYDMTSEAGQARMKGWDKGQGILRDRLAEMLSKKKDDAKAKKAKAKKGAEEATIN